MVDEFTNKAAIYFDYNLAVITNMDKTVIGTSIGICHTANISFVAAITGNSYQWQENPGTGFTSLTNTGIYSGVNTATLLLTAPLVGLYGYCYRCVVNGTINSPENKLNLLFGGRELPVRPGKTRLIGIVGSFPTLRQR